MKRLMSTVLTVGLAIAATGGLMIPAQAHTGEKAMKGTDLVKQGIAFLVEKPMEPGLALDKMKDALDATDHSGVFLDYVKQAQVAENAGDIHKARALLEASIGAKPHISGVEPAPIGQITVQPPISVDATIPNDPLELAAEFTGLNIALLVISVIAVALGAWMAFRMRPRRRQEVAA